MISVKINRDIQQYKSKVILNFNLREFLSIVIALSIVIPFHLLLAKHIPSKLTSWVEIFIVAPVLLAGFFEYHGMPFERYVMQVIKNEFLYPKVRKYISGLDFDNFIKECGKCVKRTRKRSLLKRLLKIKEKNKV